MHPIVWWITLAVVFFILELTTASFFWLWIGLGALSAGIASFLTDQAWVEYTTFAVSSILLVTVSRWWAPRFTGKTQRAANIDALAGQSALVTKVSEHQPFKGWVKTEGEFWAAETEDHEPLLLNSTVTIISVRGNILMVKK